MLVLSRRVGDVVFVSEEIEVSILEIRGSFVRLGFQAPRSVRIVRDDAINPKPGSSDESAGPKKR
jgi:carbon storage regulator